MSQRPNNIRENARKKGISTKGLSNRQLCAETNKIDECNQKSDKEILRDTTWNIKKILEDRGEDYLVEWEPTCASEREYNIFLKNIPKDIKSVEQGRFLVSWKPIEIDAKNLPKFVGVRQLDAILEKRGDKVLVSFEKGCITAEKYEQERENIDQVLDANATLIEWNPALAPKDTYTNTTISLVEPKVTNPIVAEPIVAQSQGDEDVEIDDSNEENASKKRKTCEPVEKVIRIYDPTLENLIVSPGFPSEEALDESGKKLLPKYGKSTATTKFSLFWKKKIGTDLAKLYYIDNPGQGDCMYYAVSAMIRALKPNLFQQEPNADNDMIRLRQLIATKMGNTIDAINSYITLYASQFENEQQQNSFLRNNPLLTDKDNVAERRQKLQNDLIQQSHWGHLTDFDLLQQVIGPSVHIIVLESNYNAENPPFFIVSDSITDNGKYIMIYHTSNHFVRLQEKSGKFAFTKQEFEETFPQISKLYKDFTSASDVSFELVRFKNDAFKKFLALRAKIPEKEEYDTFYYTFLRIKKGQEGDVLLKLFPLIQRYSTLSENDRNLFINTVIATLNGDVQVDKNAGASVLEAIAARRVAKFVNDKGTALSSNIVHANSISVNISNKSGFHFCTPLTVDEEKRVKNLFETAKANPDKVLINIDVFQFYGETISRLKPGQWINDEIINWEIGEIVKAHNAKYTQKVGNVNSFLYSAFLKSGRIERLKKWENPLAKGALSKLFIPVNEEETHWYLVVIDFEQKQIQIYDSICSDGKRGEEVEKLIMQYLRDILQVDTTGWTTKVILAPQQENATDCGVFMIAFVQQLQDPNFTKFTFSQKDIPCLRNRIALDLANKL